jgi:iron complex transport system substrate-binding protein
MFPATGRLLATSSQRRSLGALSVTTPPAAAIAARASIVAACVCALAACGSSSSSSGSSTGAATTRAATNGTAVTAANGVTLPHAPKRIVSLSPSATEDLFAVGAGSQVVAADRYSTYPPNAPHTSLSGFSPNVEAIAAYKPDLVVTDVDVNHLGAELAKLHIPLVLAPAPVGIPGIYGELAQLGAATGHASGGAKAVATTRGEIDAIVRSVPRPQRPLTVYHELDQTYYSASSHTFLGSLYAALGLRNIADAQHSSTGYPQLSGEYVIASSPSLIVLADTKCCHQSPATVAARPGWSNIAAVKTGAVLGVDDSVASQWGPRIVAFLGTVAAEVRKLEAKQ